MAARVNAGRRKGLPGFALVGMVAFALAGCGTGTSTPATFPAQTFGPAPASGPEVGATYDALVRALGAASLQLDDANVPHRPAEAVSFAAAPRAVFQVVLPDDPTHGFISVYQFADEAAAATAGREQAAYIASGPGRVQFPPDTRFVIRQLGPTVIFYAWSPMNSPDRRAAEIQPVIETIGTAIAIPN